MTSFKSSLTFFVFLTLCSVMYAQPENFAQIDELLNKAEQLYTAKKYSAAVIAAKSALQLQYKYRVVPDKKTAQILRKTGVFSTENKDLLEASSYLNEALDVLTKIGESNSPEAALVYLGLARLAQNRGDFATEILHLRSALEIEKIAFGADSEHAASGMMVLAGSLANIGQFEEALKLDLLAVEIKRKKFGNKSAEVGAALIRVASDMLNLQYYEEASKYVGPALEILRNVKAVPSELANAYTMQGLLDSRTNKFASAIGNFDKALAIYGADASHDAHRIASTLIHQGQAYRLTLQLEDALKCFQKARVIFVDLYGEFNPNIAVALYGIAETSFLKQDFETALAACDEARHITKDNFVNVLPFLPEREQLSFIENEDTQRFAEILSAAKMLSESDAAVSLSAEWTINAKGVAQEALIAQNRMLARLANSNRKKDVEELVMLRQQIAQLALAKPDSETEGQLKEEFQSLNDRVEALTRELVAAGDSSSMEGSWVAIEDVQRSIDANTYIVQFARFRQFLFDDESNWGADNYVAWVIPPAGAGKIRMIDLGVAEPIDKLISETRNEIDQAARPNGSIKKNGEEAASKQLSSKLSLLHKMIFESIAPHVRKAKKLVLSPDSTLWLAPWPALPSDDKSKFLIEQFTLSFVISPSQLLSETEPATDLAPPVIFANPKFDLTPDSVWKSICAVLRTQAPAESERSRSVKTFSNHSFANVLALPGTSTEATLISPMLEQYTGKKPFRYENQYALETVARSMKRPSVVAFGTHGFFLDPQKSATNSTANKEDVPVNQNPLTQCGLLMAGCKATNAGKDTAGDDGVLTGMEIASLDLNETELVILSACETAVGSPRVGEGVASLCQAFQLAGARTVVASLWAVPDRESALLINKFVEELAGGKPKAEAMQAAQIDRITRRRDRFGAAHPYFWSAFTVNGK